MVTIFIYNICVLNNILEADRLYREFRGGILKVDGLCKKFFERCTGHVCDDLI